MGGWGIFGIVVGAIVLLIVILAMIPVNVILDVANTDIKVTLKCLFVKKVLYPEKKKGDKKKDKKAIKKKTEEKKEESEQESKSLSELIDFIADIREVASEVLKKLGNHIKLKVEEYDILVAGFDASVIAMLYGGLQLVFGNLFAVLEGCKWFSVSNKCKGVHADFLEEKAKAKFLLKASMNAVGVIIVLMPVATKYLKENKGEKNRGK